MAAAVIIDLFVFRTRLVRRPGFLGFYAIIFFFQLITNGMFTGFGIVQYDGAAIIGSTSPTTSRHRSSVTGEWRLRPWKICSSVSRRSCCHCPCGCCSVAEDRPDAHRGPTYVAPERGRIAPAFSMTCASARADSHAPIHAYEGLIPCT